MHCAASATAHWHRRRATRRPLSALRRRSRCAPRALTHGHNSHTHGHNSPNAGTTLTQHGHNRRWARARDAAAETGARRRVSLTNCTRECAGHVCGAQRPAGGARRRCDGAVRGGCVRACSVCSAVRVCWQRALTRVPCSFEHVSLARVRAQRGDCWQRSASARPWRARRRSCRRGCVCARARVRAFAAAVQ